jgi:hypothetical protein
MEEDLQSSQIEEKDTSHLGIQDIIGEKRWSKLQQIRTKLTQLQSSNITNNQKRRFKSNKVAKG